MKKIKLKKLMFSLYFICQKFMIFAQESLLIKEEQQEDAVQQSLSKILGTILTIIGSVYIKILAIVCCTMVGIRLILTKNINEAMKKFLAFMIGCFLVVFTPDIVKNVFKFKRNMKSYQTISIFHPASSFGDSEKEKEKFKLFDR